MFASTPAGTLRTRTARTKCWRAYYFLGGAVDVLSMLSGAAQLLVLDDSDDDDDVAAHRGCSTRI